MISFGSKINRCYSLYVPFNGKEISIQLYFSRNNTYLGFVYDDVVNNMIKNKNVNVQIYKDLNDSIFAKTFLQYKDLLTKEYSL